MAAHSYEICRHHHERYDGSGYPDGLKGNAIPMCAQVVGIVDAYDAWNKKTEKIHKSQKVHFRSVLEMLKLIDSSFI